ncbi:MAG: hypothetical protein ACOX8W_06635 [bacterium]|jgi:hypothetical protein
MQVKNNQVLLVLLILLSLLTNVGCSSVTPPDKVVDSFLTALHEGRIEDMARYVIPSEDEEAVISELDDPEKANFVNMVLPKISHKINSTSIDGGNAIVKTSITAPDLLRVFTKVISEMMPLLFVSAFSEDSDANNSEEMINAYLENSLSDPNVPMTTIDADIVLKKIDGQWLIEPSEDLGNALTGNLAKAFAAFEDKASTE